MMIIGTNHAVKTACELQVMLDDKPLKQFEHLNYLGLVVDNRLNRNDRISYISSKVYPKLKMSNRISYFLSTNVLLRIYRQNIIPIFDYGGIVWGDCGKQTLCAHKIKQCVSP